MSRPHTFRDPIHGDVYVTETEAAIIDTADFQRLGRVRQLGTSQLVYRGAVHTRFDHAIGTLSAAKKVIDTIKWNASRWGGLTIDEQARDVIRVCALLHDIGHVPFGHTLEDETKVLGLKHDSPQALQGLIENIFKSVDFQDVALVLKCLTATDDPEKKNQGCTLASELDWPFAYDVIGNTVCADILDYLRRDNYFCGLKGNYDERLLDYLYIDPASRRTVLSLTKPGHSTLRSDVASELLNLLQQRYYLSERVYYHHTKCYTSAMVSAAVHGATYKLDMTQRRSVLLEYGDDELVSWLATHPDEVANRLGNALKERRVYKPVYMIRRAHDWHPRQQEWDIQPPSNAEQWNNNPDARWHFDRLLELRNDLDRGTIVSYCPDPQMQLKLARIRVGNGQSVARLDEVLPAISGPGREIREVLGNRVRDFESVIESHKALWRLYVLIDPGELRKRPTLGAEIARDCEDMLGCKSELNDIQPSQGAWPARAVERCEREYPVVLPLDERVSLQERLRETVLARREFAQDQYPEPRVNTQHVAGLRKLL